MNSRTPTRKQSTLVDAAQARLAVEALFEPGRPRGEAADVDVVVKRRRIALTDDRGNENDVAQVVAGEVRTSRIFKVNRPQEGGQDGREPPASADLQPAPGGAASDTAESQPARRRRRRLNGEVTIIRPKASKPGARHDGSSAASLEPDAIKDPQAGDVGMFGIDLEAQGRHEKLLAQIARLERQAHAIRKAEAAAAIRWIRKAIDDYGIEASEIGL